MQHFNFNGHTVACVRVSHHTVGVDHIGNAAAEGLLWVQPFLLSPPCQARAVLFMRLLSIMNGKSGVRLQVAEFLKQVLNGGGAVPLPVAPEQEIMAALADACKGVGPLGLAEALQAAGAEPPFLSAAERTILQSGGNASAGIGALAVMWGRSLVGAATAVAALSCEAFGAGTKPFDADVMEAGGYKAAAAAADQLRGLLEGSKSVGTRKGATQQQLAMFSSLPQVRLLGLIDSSYLWL